jgi:hypothetical protein
MVGVRVEVTVNVRGVTVRVRGRSGMHLVKGARVRVWVGESCGW